MQQKIVITGGPGTGKTMIINELINRNHKCMEEVSREITLKARAEGKEQLFLTEPLLFSQLLLEGRINQYLEANKYKEKCVFFDRGIPDVHSYMNFFNATFPDIYIESSDKYRYTHIFLLPPWKEIYTTDNERYETFKESLEIYKHLKNGYKNSGYKVIEVPFGIVTERTNFILNAL
ncbi:MAG: ATP-binding protein [Flavobacteriaceae bacterium]|nr:ATP-binding protein [Flavobacteriaceae bacterium]